jgi:hypothetical protein
MVAQVNITAETDADFYQQFTYTLSDGVTPVNITGATFTFGVRRSITDPGVLFKITSTQTASGAVIPINAPSGIFALWITKTALQAAPPGTWAQSLVVTLPGAVPVSPPMNLSQLVWTGNLTINLGPAR